jgi:hypothetical protein
LYEVARKWVREVPVRRHAQDLKVAVLFQVVYIDPKALTAKIANIKSIERVKRGNSFLLINLHFLLGKLNATRHLIVYSDLQTKKHVSPKYKGVNRIACVYFT